MSTEEKKKSITIPLPSTNSITVILVVLLIGAAFAVGSLQGKLSVLKGGKLTQTTGSAQAPSQPEQATTGKASVDDDPFIGDANAPITIIEFSDYECPFCKRFFDETLPELKEKYVDTGKVKMVYRDLPLSFHDPMATKEAIAANCAREQGGDSKYFEYHDEIFTRTISNGNGLNDDDLTSIASDVGLNLGQFEICQSDVAQADEVKKDLADAGAAGATGTPTFIIGKSSKDGVIDGQLVVGAQPFSVFEAILTTLE